MKIVSMVLFALISSVGMIYFSFQIVYTVLERKLRFLLRGMFALAVCIVASVLLLQHACSDKLDNKEKSNMFDEIEWVSVDERKPSGYIVADEGTGYKETAEYFVHIKGAAYPTFAYYLDGRFIPCYGSKHIAFYGEIDYWAEVPRWKH